jgi:hypothetical protein
MTEVMVKAFHLTLLGELIYASLFSFFCKFTSAAVSAPLAVTIYQVVHTYCIDTMERYEPMAI